jgi:UDP-glucuronate decarboxylase
MQILGALREKIINSNDTFVITGTNGWIAKALLEILHIYLGEQFNKRVIACSNSTDSITLQDGTIIECYPFNNINDLASDRTYKMFHFAFLTKEKANKMTAEDYISSNLGIRDIVADFIKNKRLSGMIYASSGAVYNTDKSLCNDIAKNPYGFLKVQDEIFFTELSKQYNFNLVIPRIFNIAGPYINKWQDYAISDFIMQAKQSNQINISAKANVYRSYIHVCDLANLLLLTSYDVDEQNIIFDTLGTEIIEMDDLANEIANQIDNGTIISRSKDSNISDNAYYGDGKIQARLLEKYNYNIYGMQRIINDTITYLNDTNLSK